MGGALIGGLLAADIFKPAEIVVAEPGAARRRALKSKFRVRALGDNRAAVAGAETVALAVKPQQMGAVLAELAEEIGPNSLVISVAAGVRAGTIEKALGGLPVIRAMPNTPALLRAGAMVFCLGKAARPAHEARARKILGALGPVWKVEERHMDAVTALSGSGPAYVFYLAEGMARAGRTLGLPPDIAEALARQTVYGAGRLLAESPETASELRRRVTSPGGTTEAALNVLGDGRLMTILKSTLSAARRRAKELSAAG